MKIRTEPRQGGRMEYAMEGFGKGMLAGMLLGAGAAAVLQPLDRKDMKRMKCRAEKAAKTAGTMVEQMLH